MIHNLGQALSLLARHEASERMSHEDVDRMYAPSECHHLVSKNEHRRFRLVKRHVKAITQRNLRVVWREAKKRGMRENDWERLVGIHYTFPY